MTEYVCLKCGDDFSRRATKCGECGGKILNLEMAKNQCDRILRSE